MATINTIAKPHSVEYYLWGDLQKHFAQSLNIRIEDFRKKYAREWMNCFGLVNPRGIQFHHITHTQVLSVEFRQIVRTLYGSKTEIAIYYSGF